MRSGPPDSLDRLVARNFAALAADLILAGKTGRLVSIQGGRYTTEPLGVVGEGRKLVDVDRFYDRERYRPSFVGVMGLPMFLC
jgi:6-phosphofructokinase 1